MINLSMPYELILDFARRKYAACTDPTECDRLDLAIQALEREGQDITPEQKAAFLDVLMDYYKSMT